MPAWCASRGLDGRSLRHWARRLEGGAELRFVEMAVPATNPKTEPVDSTRRGPSSPIRLRVEGVTIVVGDAFSEEALTRVLRAVRAC
jgi:hypothetical protein